MRRPGRVLFLLALLGWCMSSMGAGLIVVEHWIPPIPPPRPIPPPWPPPPWHPRPEPYVFAPLEVVSIEATTRITGQVAVTGIDQVFYNPNSTRLEGTFMLPLPKGSHIDKFTLEIDGQPCEAELLKAGKARKIYEDIVRNLKDPALLEYAERDLLKVRIFPIEPRSKRRINLRYTELLKMDSGLVQYSLPLGAEKFSSRPVSNVTVRVEIDTQLLLKTIYSPSHEIEVKRQSPTRAIVQMESTRSVAGDFSLLFAPEADEIGFNLLTHKEEGEEGYFLLLASPGLDVAPKEVVAKDIAFVLDTSGSMAGKKLQQAKKALEFCIENLNERDRFQIIRFSTETESLFDGLVSASARNTEKALEFVSALRPMGGTAIEAALLEALELRARDKSEERPFFVIFLTDGRPTIGTTKEEEIVKSVRKLNDARHRVFCFGIGTDVNTHLLDKITESTRAFSQYVLPEEDLELKVSSFYSKIKEPVLANPDLDVGGSIRISKYYPSELPDLFKGQQLIVAGRYSGNGDAAIKIEGSVNGRKEKFTFEGKFPARSEEHEFLPRLWATRRIGYLLDEIRLNGDNKEVREEITELARRYGIVTPYTSYLIVEDEQRRNVPQDRRLLRDLGSDEQAHSFSRQMWGDLSSTSDGLAAASAAREAQAYRHATAPSVAAASGQLESSRAMGLAGGGGGASSSTPAPGQESKARLAEYSKQTRFAGGKTFFWNDDRWMDSEVQQLTNPERVQVRFGSEEYFDLCRQSPEVLPWLALGKKVEFVLEARVYSIVVP